MWQRIYALIIKEFLSILKDKKSRMVIIFPPLIQLFLFGYAANFDLNDIRMGVYNEDRGAAARDLAARFDGANNFRVVKYLKAEREIAPLIDKKKVLLVLHVGSDFSRKLQQGQPADIQVIIDGRNSTTAQTALNYVSTIVAAFNRYWRLSNNQAAAPARLIARAWYNPNLNSRWYFLPGIVGILPLVITVMVTALTVAREREEGTFDQLLVTPMGPVEILIGKAVPGLLIGLFEASIIALLAVWWFNVPFRGNLLTLYAGLILFLLATVGVGLMISSLSMTLQQSLLGGFLFIMPSVLLSGFATPITNMPAWVQKITLINPLRYMLIILRGTYLEGKSFELIMDELWPMAIISLVTLSVAAWLFRRRMY
jgi:ABC-2 type transport system permease protein